MTKKKNKKKRIFKFFLILIFIGLAFIYIFTLPIKNIYITGNNILSEQEIIELANIENYPRLFANSATSIENKIKISPFIEDVKVSKNLLGAIYIEVLEYNILLKDETDNQVYLSNAEKITLDFDYLGVPSLINYVEPDILKEFLKKLNTIDSEVLSKISEIEYTPNEYDKDLFLFYMNDGNYVYITTTRLSNINKYESVLEQLEGKKGILYLDSGNHFSIIS